MPLKRVSCQSSKSLEEFYGEMEASKDSVSASTGLGMLDLLPMLTEFCKPLEVWGLTSLSHLWLLPSDAPSQWLVSITSFAVGYRIQYRMTDAEAPWRDAFVEGHAIDAAEACRLILIAIKRSGGWVEA